MNENKTAKTPADGEPVAWMGVDSYGNVIKFRTNEFGGGIPLYTAPPKREWVGLTDGEREEATGWSVDHIEAFLKDKNT